MVVDEVYWNPKDKDSISKGNNSITPVIQDAQAMVVDEVYWASDKKKYKK